MDCKKHNHEICSCGHCEGKHCKDENCHGCTVADCACEGFSKQSLVSTPFFAPSGAVWRKGEIKPSG